MNTETVQISVPKAALVEAFLEKMARTTAPADIPLTDMQARSALLPAIGAPMDGGLYAGITIHLGMPHALVLLPGDEGLDWKAAMAWAEKNNGALPSRIDMLVLWQNLPKEFQETWYWTSETNARYADCAWLQTFDSGYQSNVHKSLDSRCRAVRSEDLRGSLFLRAAGRGLARLPAHEAQHAGGTHLRARPRGEPGGAQ